MNKCNYKEHRNHMLLWAHCSSSCWSFLIIVGKVFQIKIFSSHSFIHFKNVFSFIFKMRSCIETSRNKQSIVFRCHWFISIRNFDELLFDCADNIKSNLQLLLWLVGLDDCTDNSNVSVFFANAVNWWNHHDIDVYFKFINYHSSFLFAFEG